MGLQFSVFNLQRKVVLLLEKSQHITRSQFGTHANFTLTKHYWERNFNYSLIETEFNWLPLKWVIQWLYQQLYLCPVTASPLLVFAHLWKTVFALRQTWLCLSVMSSLIFALCWKHIENLNAEAHVLFCFSCGVFYVQMVPYCLTFGALA